MKSDLYNIINNYKANIFIIVLLPFVIALHLFLSTMPSTVEFFYSQKLFYIIASILSFLFNIFPFSVFEVIIIILFCTIIFYPIYTISKILLKPENIIKILMVFILKSMSFFSIIYFLFIFLWGLNYNRMPLSDTLNLNTEPASVIELESLCKNLLEKTLMLRERVKEDSSGVMIFDGDLESMINQTPLGYKNLSEQHKIFLGKYSTPKKMYLLSYIMSLTTTSGIYSPITGEANINIYPPLIFAPMTICHEIAHQIGFAREDEASFIGYLACKYHPNINYQYSGYLSVLTQAMNQLYKYDKTKFYDLKKQYSAGMKNDLNSVRKYWQQYSGTYVEKISEKTYNAYLKSNNQKDGIQSYGRVVDLLIGELRKDLKLK